MRMKRIALAAALLATSISAQAEYYGTASGRSANPANSSGFSIEPFAGLASDYQSIGVRLNLNINESITIYGDFGKSERFFTDGTSFGAGIFYYLPQLSESMSFLNTMDVAVQASYHIAQLEYFGVDYDSNSLAAVLLVSPKTALNENGLNWYANAGLSRLSFRDRTFNFFGVAGTRSNNSIEPHAGGGIYMPLGPGTFYAGADLIDEPIAGVGYRFGF